MIEKYERRRNYMSYMIVIKGSEGTVIASDSYSCYYTRKLKDAHYKKIHEMIPEHFVIGVTGLNVLYDENDNYLDINVLLNSIFANCKIYELENKIEQFANIVQTSCDNFGVDASIVYIYDNEMFLTDIIHQLGHQTHYWKSNVYDILFMGEDYHAKYARNDFEKKDMFLLWNHTIDKCIKSVQKQIQFENEHFPEGQRIVGEDIQYAFVKKQ